MPLESYKLLPSLQSKINKRVAALVDDGIIAGVVPDESNYHLSFYMSIQLIPKYSRQRFSFGKPEGIRVFISVGRKIHAAIDFMFNKPGIQLSHVYQGPPLAQLMRTINKLKHEFAEYKGHAYAELITFFYTRSIFILVRSGKSRFFYRSFRGKLAQITLPELRSEIDALLNDPPKFEES